jgi:hypothetical protein
VAGEGWGAGAGPDVAYRRPSSGGGWKRVRIRLGVKSEGQGQEPRARRGAMMKERVSQGGGKAAPLRVIG